MASAEFPDSTAKRKRGIDETPKIDSGGCGGSAMAKPKEKAKLSRQVSEFKDTYGIFDPFNKKMIFEIEDFDPSRDYFESDDDEVEEVREAPFDRNAVLKYIKQVRQSFGFDVDVNLPGWLVDSCYFFLLNLSADPSFNHHYVHKAANLAIDEINVDLNGKRAYELVEVVKTVLTTSCFSLMFMTLTAKKVGEAEAAVVTIQAIVHDPIGGPMELHQWRFKPAEEP